MHVVTVADILNTAHDIARINHAMSQALAQLAKATETGMAAQLTILSAAAELSSDKANMLGHFTRDHKASL